MSRIKSEPTIAELNSVRELAKTGDANANYRLGYWYETGEGFTQNYAAALIHYKVAAKQGLADAQSRAAGVILELSKPGRKQFDEYFDAIQYAKAAAAQGHGGAKIVLTTIWREMTEIVSSGLLTDFKAASIGIKAEEAVDLAHDILEFILEQSPKRSQKQRSQPVAANR